MGLFDYERLSSEMYPVKASSGKVSSFIEQMSNNTNWVKENSVWLSKSDPIVSLLNRKVLKATPLREEIYFVKCQCYDLNGNFNIFTFVVNEHTIFKRFRVYKNITTDIDYFYKSETNLTDYLKYLTDTNYKIALKLFNNEIIDLPKTIDQAYNNTNAYKYYNSWDLRDGMVVEPINIQHYNKRTWIYLLTTHNEENLDIDYKNNNSDAFYDKDFAKKYN